MPKLLTLQETASFLRLSIRTLDRFRKDGLLPFVKVRGTIRIIRIREDLEAFLAQHTVMP